MDLSKGELLNLRQSAQKALEFGDGTLRIDANDLCLLIELALEFEHNGGDDAARYPMTRHAGVV